ncbi:hypothetical protein [Neisseria dentiae]|uniref:hypothetical protein n=1 Tax=Neisseria dentiae TaxID=194197 RepID=UPI0035A178F2
MNKELLGLIFLPAGVMSMAAAALWQMHVVMAESYTLNRFKDKQLLWVVSAMFFSFTLALYIFCPNARKKGILFWVLAIGGAVMYFLAKLWLPLRK